MPSNYQIMEKGSSFLFSKTNWKCEQNPPLRDNFRNVFYDVWTCLTGPPIETRYPVLHSVDLSRKVKSVTCNFLGNFI